jgi:fatty acid desaturase
MSYMPSKKYYMDAFRALSKDSRATSTFILSSYVGQIVVAIALGSYLVHLDSHFSVFLAVLLALFIGTRFRGLNNILHECSHLSFTTKRADNVLLGRIVASLLLKSFESYKTEHMSHHAHLGDYEHDLDFHRLQKFKLEDELTPKTIARHVATPLLGLHITSYVSFDMSFQDGKVFGWLKIALLLATTVYVLVDPIAALLMIVFPFVWVYSALNYWTDCIDHGGILEAGHELEQSRNVIVNPIVRFFLFPRNDCYHLIHHLFPGVPVNHFDRCHEELLQDPQYRAAAGRQIVSSGHVAPSQA